MKKNKKKKKKHTHTLLPHIKKKTHTHTAPTQLPMDSEMAAQMIRDNKVFVKRKIKKKKSNTNTKTNQSDEMEIENQESDETNITNTTNPKNKNKNKKQTKQNKKMKKSKLTVKNGKQSKHGDENEMTEENDESKDYAGDQENEEENEENEEKKNESKPLMSWYTTLDVGTQGPWQSDYHSMLHDMYFNAIIDGRRLFDSLNDIFEIKGLGRDLFLRNQAMNCYCRSLIYLGVSLAFSKWSQLSTMPRNCWFQYIVNKYSYISFPVQTNDESFVKNFYNSCLKTSTVGKICVSDLIAGNIFFRGWHRLFKILDDSVGKKKETPFVKLRKGSVWPNVEIVKEYVMNGFYEKYGSAFPLSVYETYQ